MRLILFVCLGWLSSLSFGAIQVEEVESWAASHPKAQVEDFLNWVKDKDPEQFTWFTLMRKSQSAQGSSALNPRAIVFGPESKFIFTFNGEAQQAGFQEVEMMFFRDFPRARWELRKLSFGEQGKTIFSGANPKSCLACHQNPVRPIWSQYDRWEGAYGEDDDAIPDFENDKYAISSSSNDVLQKRKKELQDLKVFLAHKASHPRYSYLQSAEGSPVSPFAPNGRYSNYRFRPNLRLTESLSQLHAKTLLAKLKSHPQYEKEKKLLLALLLGCNELVEEPSSIKFLQELEVTFSNYRGEVKNWNRRGYVGENSRKSYLLYLLGVEQTDFSLERNPEYWAYFEGSLYSDESLMMEIYADIKGTESSFPSLNYNNRYGDLRTVPPGFDEGKVSIHEACKLLLNSREGAGKIEAQGPEKLKDSIATCVGCHGKGGSGPYIPFEYKEALLKNPRMIDEILIRISDEESTKKMPPTRPLSHKEREGIREWLLNLTQLEN